MSLIRLSASVIDPSALTALVTGPDRGAVTVFLGTVRDTNDGRRVTGIEYAAYDAMARAELGRIVGEAEATFEDVRVAVAHRTGYLEVGDVSVAIAAAHAHRTPSMDAARYVIEQLKQRVPIWKREHYADGTREWVDPTSARAAVTT